MLNVIHIFDPKKSFINELPGSWCDNIITNSNKPYIPIDKSTSPPSLMLDSKKDKDYFIGVLPISRDWKETDLSGYRELKFTMMTSKTDFPMVLVQLTSGNGDKESDSNTVDLCKCGLSEYSTQEFTIDLNEFNQDKFNIREARLIKFIGQGNFCISLSNITIQR